MENSVWFRIKRHRDIATRDASIAEKIKELRAIAIGPIATIVKITFDGYDDDMRELCEVEEVRHWMQAVFFEVPEALAFLDQETFGIAETCCNKVIRLVKTVGSRGSPASAQIELSPRWLAALSAAGLSE